MSKKRNKRHNIHKRHALYSRALLKQLNSAVVWIAGQRNNACVLANMKTGDLIPIGKELQGAIADVAHDWSVYCAVFGRRQDGEEYMRGVQVDAPRCYQHHIADQLNEIHMREFESMNPNHRVGLGWIACPWGADISEEMAGRLFDRLGAWDNEKLEVA